MSVLRIRGYLGCVYTLGAAALIWVFASTSWAVPVRLYGIIAVTAVLIVVGELFPIRLWGMGSVNEYTFSGAFTLALLPAGPIVYAVIPQLAALLGEELRNRKPLKVLAFNLAQNGIMFVLARLAICTVEGVGFGGYADVSTGKQLLGLAVGAPVYFLVNNILTGTVIAFSGNTPVLASIVTTLRKEIPVTPIVLGLAPLVIAGLRFSLWTAPLLLFLIIAIRQAVKIGTEHEIAALHDSLTGLPNRAMLLMRLDQELPDARRPGRQAALLMVDLDHFKEINDTLGHAVGDELMRLVAARLREAVRERDTVARLGGDEFAVVIPDGTEEVATELAHRLATTLRQPFRLAEVTLNVGASVGIALAPEHGTDVESLMRHADVALYTAKQNRGGYAVYDPRSDEHSTERPVLMGQLRRGIDRGELVVYYQPKVSIRTGQFCGAEALVRWQHPTRGLLPPAQFLPAVENSGLIVPLTDQVIHKALAAVRQWRAHGVHASVSVNVTARQVTNLDLPSQIVDALAMYSLPGDALVIEVTESCLMSDAVRARTVLSQLREAGIGLSIDDFGTGYSSFTHLRDLPMSEIKIDRSFVTTAADSTANAAIVKSTIELAHNLGLQVVAEGVETQPCLDLLTDMGCDLVQGHLLARPMPASELLTWSTAQAIGYNTLQRANFRLQAA
jgi:diguanylate cyclase (GGDEF)-like protein